MQIAATILHIGRQEWQSDNHFLTLQTEQVTAKKDLPPAPHWDAVTSTEPHRT